nr:E3 ubiquitin-protein ligase rnf213-alpha-like [Oncorhynchus nerka]
MYKIGYIKMKCPGCGHQVEKSSKFCSECGLRLAAQICTTGGTTSEHQTSVVREAEPQKEAAPLTSAGNKTDAPTKHSSEEPGGNVKKKSGGSSSAIELSTDTRQEKDELSGSERSTSAVDDPPVNTATPTGPPVNTATPTGPPVNTATPTDPPVNTATPTGPPVNTATPTGPPVNTATPTDPPVNTATPTGPPVNTATPTGPPVNTATPTGPPVNTATPTGPPVNTATPTGPPVNTATPTGPPVNTATPTGPPVNTATPTGPPVNTATPTGPPVNTARPAGPPTMPIASPNPSPHQTLPEDQAKGPSKANVDAPVNEPNQPSPTSVTQASSTPETADQNTGGRASDPTQPASKLLDEEDLKGTSHGSTEPSKSLDGEGNTEVRVLNELKTSSNQTDENITNEANSKKCVDQSQVSLGDQRGSDPTDEPNTSQTQSASPAPSVTQEVPEKTSKRKDQNRTEPASGPSQSVGQSYKDVLVGTSQETGDLSRGQGIGASNYRDQSRKNEANSQNFVFGSHKAEAGDKPQESRQETSKPNKEPAKLSNTGGGDASKTSTIDATVAGKDLPPNQRNEDCFQHQPLPPQLPPRTQQVPRSDDLTIYFHAVISKDFNLNSTDRIFLRCASLFGSWEIDGLEMFVTRDLGKDRVLVAGRMVIPDRSKIEIRSIPYKYFVYSKWNGKHYDHGTYEHIYQTNSRYIVNRCLSINQDLLTHEGEWHQYDDVIYPEPKQDVLSRVTNMFQWWDNINSNLVKGRQLAGKVMLEGIFDLLRTWTEVNVRSFFSQLQQFFSTYSYPCVYDGGKTPWQLSFGEDQVKKLMKDFMEENLDPQSQKGREKHEVFLSDPLKAGIIILIVYNKYRLKEDNGSQLSHLCQLLCLPKKPRDDFLAYWTDFTQGLPKHISVAEEVKSLCNVAREGRVVSWILVIPLLHLLRGDSKPFEPVPPTMDPPFTTWAGLKGIKIKDSYRDTRGLMKVMTEHKHLVEVDHLLVPSWMSLLQLEDLMSFISVIHVGVLDTLRCLQFSLPVKSGMYYSDYVEPVGKLLSHLIDKITGQHFSDNRYRECCLKTAVSVLGTICKDTDSDRCDLPLNCLHLVSLIAETSGSSHPQSVKSKENEVLEETLRTMRDWRRKAFPSKSVNHGSYFTSKNEIKVWKKLISVTFGNEEFTELWRSTFLNDFEGKLKKEKPMHQIQIYCDKIEEVGKTSLYLCNSLEKCALEAVTAICQDKSNLRELLKKHDFNKFEKLMSVIVLKSWPQNGDGQYVEGEELVMKHLLSWPMAISIFQVQGANGALINRLTDEAKERMGVASSAFCSVAKKFIYGNIQIQTLNQILERKTEFTQLLKIDDLCDDGRCQDGDAMKRLLRWREEEVEAIVNDKMVVEGLLIFCQKLQEHLKIDVRELQRKNQENIDQMTLDDFMEVHRLDHDSSNVTGVVTYFNLCDDTRQMASSLRAIRDSYIFTMCWENQAKELSQNQLDTDETEPKPERETEVYTLDLIHSEIFQSCNDNYRSIYESLRSGTISLEEVDSIFEAYKDKYKDMDKDLKIMCRINSADDGRWIKSRVQQIQQYHELHLALESAKVIMDVRETICPQGDFKVLQTLLDMNTEDFKEESLNRIDDNLLEIKKDLEDITEPRRRCLRELGLWINFVKWVKEALEDINELKVFVDLASISAGENDLDVDRVACFHDAVLGYSSMLYGLPPDADFHAFKEALTKLWKALGNDSNIPNKLRDTARHLEWLKTVKDSHGSVELSSLSLATSINTRGIYIISAQNQKKLCLDTALKLQIPEHQEEDQMRNYSLEDLRDLQNKLMLMSGKGEPSQIEVDHFTEVFDSVQRLAVAFVDLYAAGNPLFRCWEAKIHCNTQSDTGIVMEFNLGNILQNIMVEGNAMDHLTDLCRKIEVCLDDWNRFMDKQRSQHYYLNYYTAEQIVYLCNVLTEKNLNTKLDEKVLMMLSFIKPDCSVSDVWETWMTFQNNMTETEQDEDPRFQTFIDLHNDLGDFDSSFADEDKCAIDVLQSLLDQAVGLRKLDLVWDAYMKDMRSILQDSLDTRSFGRLLEMLANKENQEEDDEEPMLLEPSENTVRRKLPKGLFNCQPNLIICPQDEILTSSICLYMTSDYEQLPTYDEVLLCTPATSYEQVELFFRRCLTLGYLGEKIYTLLFADQLSYEVSYAVEKLFQKLSSYSRSNYRLVIICSAEREHTYIPTAFNQFKRNMVPQESLERIQRYLSRHYTVPSHQTSAASVFKGRHFVGIVSSQRAGVGKSLYIQRLYEKLEGTVTMGTTFRKCIRLIEPEVDEHIILQSLFETPESKEHKVFHFDVTSSVQKGLHEFLFKLFFLRYLTDSDGLMWKCSNKHLYVIETLQSTNEPLRHASRSDPKGHFPLFEVFPKVFCRPPKEVMGLEARIGDDPVLDTEDPLMDDHCFRSETFQRPYQYLTRFHRGENLDSFNYQRVEGTHAECLQMLFIYCGIIDPSWAELKNFAGFLNLQLLDCETSDFCNFEFVGDTLRGFRNFVVDFMILMAKDFATPSLCIADQSHGRQPMDTGLDERDLAPFLIRKRWESEPHPYIFFNDDHVSMTFIGFHLRLNEQNGVDAINPSTNAVIKRNIMTKNLYNGLRHQRVPFNIDFDQLSRADKIERLCSVLGNKWPTDPDETYELTTDNILKMMAIHMRFRCGIPVIIMGETGCGKTRLIKFLCELRRSGAPTENMKLVKVHGGTTSDMIYNKVREAEKIAVANKEKHDFDSVLFFDEANTTEAISSIKEILCDNTVQGQQLSSQTGLQIIAACNPYRKHTDDMIKRLEAAGLGYRVRAEETEERLGSIPLRQLVYRVQVLPPSMIPLVWDFGQLSDHTEKMYIQQIVQRVVETNSINRESIRMITDVLSSSQGFMRERKDECSFVSLRDVERCMQVFVWFYNNHSLFQNELKAFLQKQPQEERSRSDQLHSPASDPVVWSLLMAVGVCYQACLEKKGEYQTTICKFLPQVTPKQMKQEISVMQDLLLSGVPMGETIARNKALKENVFMMVICIELRIPLFLVGKPGSSKSLSKTLVADAMQGQAAHSELYKRLKQVHLVSFQCSPHSTPEGIINTFRQCARFQESKNLEEYISVVVLDEIGLAEDSPKMPLKTLHPLLEEGCIDDEPLPHKRVGFIGISNWALDPAKMNRGLFVSRGDPDQNELLESAKGICSSDKMILEKVKHLFTPFSQAYMTTCKKGKGFFGLRDYYSLVKMMFAITKASKQSPSTGKIIEAVLRNFSGRDDVDAVSIFTKELPGQFIQPDLDGISTIDLVKQNIVSIYQDEECRYLLVLTKNYAALQILQQTFFSDHNHPEIIFGSSFPKDQEYTQICRNINRVKICMETGQTVVLLNLQNLYESLYDALNQYYVSLGGQKYVDLGLGTHRVKCRVHKNFRLIVIEEKEVVYKQFPIPLINRLEKHYLDINTVLKKDQTEIVEQLKEWVKHFVSLKSQQSKTDRYNPHDVFIGYHSDTCSSVVLQVTEKMKTESDESDTQRRVLDEAKLIMLNCATPDSVIRLDGTKLSADETESLTQIYFEEQNHHSLADFIASHTQEEEWLHYHFTEVTTFSRLLTAADIHQLQNITELCNVKLLSLQQFDTEHSFLKEIRQFLDSTSDDKVLIIQTDYDEDSQSMNILASAKYSSINEINKSKEGDNGRVFVYFVTKLPRIKGGTSYVGFHGGPWKSVHIDDLRKSKEFVSDVQSLRKLPISQLFEKIEEPSEAMQTDDTYIEAHGVEHSAEFDATDLMRSCVQSAVSMLRDQEDSGALSTRRVEILLTLLDDSEDLKGHINAHDFGMRCLTSRCPHTFHHVVYHCNAAVTSNVYQFVSDVIKHLTENEHFFLLLCVFSFDEVKEYLQQYLTLIEESNILEAEDKNELYALYINCLEDSMFDRKPHECQKPADQQAYLQKETEFLSHFLDSVTASAETVTIEYLQQIARVRLCLDTAAHLLHSTQSGECENRQDAVEEFLCAVRSLCKESKNDWYRVYLIRNISSQQGVEYVQRMLRDTETYRWLFPEEVQQQNEDVGQMDQYLVYGDDYQVIREAVAKAVLEDSVQEIEDTCQRCTAPARRRTLYILLALFREVTSLYRAANTGLHPTPKQCKALEDFIEGSRYLHRREVRDFAKELVHNRMGGLSVLADRSSMEHTLIELAVHMSAVLLTGTEGLLTPLQQLGLSPNNMLSAFLPTMPEDMLAVAQRLITQNKVDYGLSWYSCPNGHPCVVDKCGQPTHKAKCLECEAEIGGENHVPLTGFQKMELQQGDLTRTGHILGDPQRRDNPDTLDTKNMSLTPFILVRLLTHLAMLRGASEQPQSIQQIIQPPVQDACQFLICHLLKDMDQLTKALGKGNDDTVTTVHLIVRSILEPSPTNQLPAANDPQLSTKEARNTWETTVATDIITPQLKNLDQQLREVNATIRDDSRVSSNFVMRVTFGDECPLSSLSQGSQVHCSGVWSCRERVSLLSLTHIVEQNDGKDKLPLLWRFLQKEAEFRLVKFLPDILALQKSLVKKFQNSSDLMDVSIREFIQRQPGPMRVWYEKQVQIFLNTWNLLRVSVATNEIKIPEDFWKEDLDLDSDLQYLLPRRQGPGLCSTALLSYLVALHNELLHSVDRHTGEDTSYKVSLSELTELHVIRYELEKDLLPLVLSNCQYSLERGKETLSEYDLPKIQQQVLTRFLQGKPLITLTGIPTLVTRHERDYDIIFKMVKGNVSQEHLPSLTLTALSRDLQSYSEVCEALKAVELALGFLSMTGGDSQMPLDRYLEDMLKMGEQMDPRILKALGRCSLKHCVALWQLLSSLKSENMLKSLKRDPFSGVSTEYQQPLEEEQKRLLQGFISKGHVDTWLLEMHEFLLLNLGKPHVSDTYRPDWSVKETLAGYMDRKGVEVLPDVEASFPDEILLSQIVETWKFTVTHQQEWMT